MKWAILIIVGAVLLAGLLVRPAFGGPSDCRQLTICVWEDGCNLRWRVEEWFEFWDCCCLALTGDRDASWTQVLAAAPKRLVKLVKHSATSALHSSAPRRVTGWWTRQLNLSRTFAPAARTQDCEAGGQTSSLIWCQ